MSDELKPCPFCGGSVYPRGERVKRTKAIASDGEPIETGQTVYATHYGYAKCTVLAIEWVVDGYLVEVENEGGHKFRQTPDEFTHQRPVLDADGAPIKKGDAVWHVASGREYAVIEPSYGETVVVRPAGCDDAEGEQYAPERLTHQRPVLDADGAPIHEGDAVWNATTSAGPFTVREIERSDDPDEPEDIVWCGEHAANGFKVWRIADQLTHAKPEIDTWERIEADCEMKSDDYARERMGMDLSVPARKSRKVDMMRDLVRRCKALAERSER